MRLLVRVPATSANLGPGFDCLGLALDLCNEAVADTEAPAGVAWEGEGARELPVDGSDMISRAMAHVAADAGRDLPPVALHGANRIPLERGLGSSAAAAVAGVLLAGGLLDLALEDDEVFRLAVEIEGHPDNAAPAVYGGFTIALGSGAPVRLDPHPGLRPVVLVPRDIRLPTAEARRALRREVPLDDAVFNAGHAALASVAFTQRPERLAEALQDRLHQDARLALVPAVREVFDALRESGIPVCVSGAGPSLLAFEHRNARIPDSREGWSVLRPGVRAQGAVLE